MKNRLIGAIFVVIVTLITFLSPNIVTSVCLGIISCVALYELLKVFHLNKSPYLVLTYLATIGVHVVLALGKDTYVLPVDIILLLLCLAFYVATYPKYKCTDIIAVFFSFNYATILLSYVYKIHGLEHGVNLCFFILISSWGNDVFAYLVGSAIGKHKITPNVSPNKSLEGFIGGVIGAGLLGLLYGYVFADWIPIPFVYCGIIAALGAIPGDFGDLAASAIKRDYEIKDYSNLIPGHGGMVDRIDSVLFTAPIIYYLIVLFM